MRNITGWDLSHGHDAAGFGPDGLQLDAVLGEEVAGVALLGGYQEASLTAVVQLAHGVAFIQMRYDFLFDFHK